RPARPGPPGLGVRHRGDPDRRRSHYRTAPLALVLVAEVELSVVADLPSHFSWQVVACMRELWPSLFSGDLKWASQPFPDGVGARHFVAHHDAVLVSYASVIRLTVDHAGETLTTAGLGNVLTSKPYRR